jgi:N-acetylmuramoyl-L-alanine amidase
MRMMKIIQYPSPNFNERPLAAKIDCVVLHYTDVATLDEALQILTDPNRESRVSCHYVIDEDGSIYQLVPAEKRAWHAGVSSLEGRENVNDFSIGIELQNGGYYAGYALTGSWPEFPDAQINALKELLNHLMTKFPITIERIVGHEHVAPKLKIDPGPAFPWGKIRKI